MRMEMKKRRENLLAIYQMVNLMVRGLKFLLKEKHMKVIGRMVKRRVKEN